MHYVISDLHGCYEQYCEMLKRIRFSESDVLYVNGDIIDRGPEPIKILQHMRQHENILPIMGNHELMGLNTLTELAKGEDPNVLDYYLWGIGENHYTVEGFMGLPEEERLQILEYIKSFPWYREVELCGTSYLITHAGFWYEDFDPEKALDSYKWEDAVWSTTDYDRVYYRDRILVTGHTPTVFIDPKHAGRIVRRNNHIAVDCGCAFGGNLGCICLETGRTRYVKGILPES